MGELVQLDGSHHDWLEGRGPRCVLMTDIDDASSRVYARFYDEEGTIPAMDRVQRDVQRYGIPLAVSADRPSPPWKTSWPGRSPRVSLGGRWVNWASS